jgi:DNA-binding PadR family transcriptional regulator
MPHEDLPRLTAKERLILDLLIGGGEMYGLELVRRAAGSLARGTVYVTLDRMEEKGFVESRREELQGGLVGPRRLYKPTGLGQRILSAYELARQHLALEV